MHKMDYLILILCGALVAAFLPGCLNLTAGDNLEPQETDQDDQGGPDCTDPPLAPTLIPTGATASAVTLTPADFARVGRFMGEAQAWFTECKIDP